MQRARPQKRGHLQAIQMRQGHEDGVQSLRRLVWGRLRGHKTLTGIPKQIASHADYCYAAKLAMDFVLDKSSARDDAILRRRRELLAVGRRDEGAHWLCNNDM